MKSMDAAGRWAKDLYRRFERGAVSGKRVAELFEAITPEARADLRMTVMVGLEELRDADRGEREFMPPCAFRYLRWLALFLHAPEDDEIGEYLMYTSDGAWTCGCRSCEAFANRVDAGTRRFVEELTRHRNDDTMRQ